MPSFTRLNDEGFIECVDDATGEVLWTEKRKSAPKEGKIDRKSSGGRGRPSKEARDTHHYVQTEEGQKLWVPKATNPADLPRSIWPYNSVTTDRICQLITEGNTIKGIGQIEGMPPAHVIHRWTRKYPEFKRDLKESLEARATHYFDRVMEIAESTDRDTIQEDRLKTELFKWAAEVGDAETYGKKSKVTNETSSPIAIHIYTGVPQIEDAKVIEAEVIKEDT